MIEIHSEFEDTHDENAFLTGFLEFKSLKAYEKGDTIPTDKDINPIPPCLVMEVLDEKESTAEIKILRPESWIPINVKQIKFIKKYIATKALQDERKRMV